MIFSFAAARRGKSNQNKTRFFSGSSPKLNWVVRAYHLKTEIRHDLGLQLGKWKGHRHKVIAQSHDNNSRKLSDPTKINQKSTKSKQTPAQPWIIPPKSYSSNSRLLFPSSDITQCWVSANYRSLSCGQIEASENTKGYDRCSAGPDSETLKSAVTGGEKVTMAEAWNNSSTKT